MPGGWRATPRTRRAGKHIEALPAPTVPAAKTFGDAIREIRMLKGLTGSAVAAAIGKSGAYISDLEHGHRVPTYTAAFRHTIGEIAAALDTNSDYLYFMAGVLPPDIAALTDDRARIIDAMYTARSILAGREVRTDG